MKVKLRMPNESFFDEVVIDPKNFKSTSVFNDEVFGWYKDTFVSMCIESYNKINNMEYKVVCPKCGNEENFHFNYDYSKKDLPIEDVLCNECGEFFEIKET